MTNIDAIAASDIKRITALYSTSYGATTPEAEAQIAFGMTRKLAARLKLTDGILVTSATVRGYGLDIGQASAAETAELRRERNAAYQQTNHALRQRDAEKARRITLEAQVAELHGRMQKLATANTGLRTENTKLAKQNKELLIENARKMTTEKRTALSPALLFGVTEELEKERAGFIAERNAARAAAKQNTATMREAIRALRISRAKGTATAAQEKDIARLMQATMATRREEQRKARLMDGRARRRAKAMMPLLQTLQTKLEAKRAKATPPAIIVPAAAVGPVRLFDMADPATLDRTFHPDVLAGHRPRARKAAQPKGATVH